MLLLKLKDTFRCVLVFGKSELVLVFACQPQLFSQAIKYFRNCVVNIIPSSLKNVQKPKKFPSKKGFKNLKIYLKTRECLKSISMAPNQTIQLHQNKHQSKKYLCDIFSQFLCYFLPILFKCPKIIEKNHQST